MASLLVLALMLSVPSPGSEKTDTILKVKVRSAAVADPLTKTKTTPEAIPDDSLTIVKRHRQAGYLDAEVEWRRSKNTVDFDVRPGPRTTVRRLDYRGNRVFTSEWLDRQMPFRAPAYFDQARVKTNIARLLELYSNAGLPLVRVVVSESLLSRDTMALLMIIDEGPVVYLAGLEIRNNKDTRDFVIRRLFSLGRDSLFDGRTIERSKGRLYKTGLFSDLQETIVAREERYWLRLDVTEQKRDYLEGWLEYRPQDEDLNFDVVLNFYNLLGTARSFFFAYDHKGNDFSLDYGEPWLIFPTQLGLSLRQETFDEQRKLRLAAQVAREVVSDLGLSAWWGIEDFPGERMQFVGLGTNLEKPHLKDSLRTEVGFHDKRHRRFTARFDGQETWWFFELGNHIAWVADDPVREQDLFRLGGARTVRGYWEDEFLAQIPLWFSIEFKKFPLYPFFDGLLILDNGLASAEPHFAYGVGLEVTSKIVGGQLDIGFPAGASWEEGKVHVRLERRL